MPMMWNNQNTLDRPPILDHYRNSADLEGTLVPRPTLMQLMHGDTIEVLDEFEVRSFPENQFLLESPTSS